MSAARMQTIEPEERDFVITRTFDAPRHLVWKAWTEGERLAQWWGPKGCTIRVVKHELRPGGVFHYAMELGHDEWWGRMVYSEVAPPERLVFVNSFSDPQGGLARAPFKETVPLEILITVTFDEDDDRTTLTLRGRPINATPEERKTYTDMFSSMQQGFGGTFDKLTQYLAKGAP